MLSIEEKNLLSKYSIALEDIDVCASFLMGDDVKSPLYYIEDSLTGATKDERRTLEAIVERRAKQLKDFLSRTPMG